MGCDTLVFLMGVSTLPGIVAQLSRHGRAANTPCAVIEWGTRPRQRTAAGRLSTIIAHVKQAAIRPPAGNNPIILHRPGSAGAIATLPASTWAFAFIYDDGANWRLGMTNGTPGADA